MDNNATLNVPPHSLAAEESVIGGLLLDSDRLSDVAEIVHAEMFYEPQCRSLYQVIQSLAARQVPANLVTVYDEIDRLELGNVIQKGYPARVQGDTAGTSSILHQARIVADRYHERSLLKAAIGIQELVFHPGGRSTTELVNEAQSLLGRIAEERDKGTGGPVAVVDAMDRYLNILGDMVERSGEGEQAITGIATGFDELDTKTTGLHPGDLVIIAGRPSMGKTTLALNACNHMAFRAQVEKPKPVLVFSLEMPTDQLMMRLNAAEGGVPIQAQRTGRLSDDHWTDTARVMELVRGNGQTMYVDDGSALTPDQVRGRARKIHRKHGGLAAIMVDYLQLMKVPALKSNRTLEISEISGSLKALAKEMGCPVIALSQLSRNLEQRTDKRPVMADLRESGAIEQDADLVLFVYRDEVYHQDSEHKGLAEIIIGKQRNGPLGTVVTRFRGDISRFENM